MLEPASCPRRVALPAAIALGCLGLLGLVDSGLVPVLLVDGC